MKPFKGVISDWVRDGDVIVGTCQYHPEMETELTPNAIMFDGIVKGHRMHTSRVEKIEYRGSFSLLETKNSFYILTGSELQ